MGTSGLVCTKFCQPSSILRMNFDGLLFVSSVICASISVEAKPKVLSYSVHKRIDQYLDEVLDILAEDLSGKPGTCPKRTNKGPCPEKKDRNSCLSTTDKRKEFDGEPCAWCKLKTGGTKGCKGLLCVPESQATSDYEKCSIKFYEECTAPKQTIDPKGMVINYCASAKDIGNPTSGNFVKIKKETPTKLYLELVVTNVCMRDDKYVGRECYCSDLLGKLLGRADMKPARTLGLR